MLQAKRTSHRDIASREFKVHFFGINLASDCNKLLNEQDSFIIYIVCVCVDLCLDILDEILISNLPDMFI